MIIIEYCRNGEAISDFNYQDFIKSIKKSISKTHNKREFPEITEGLFRVSTSLPISAIKLEIAKGNINHKEIQFKFKDKLFQPNKYGAILDWPDGFCDIEAKIMEENLIITFKRKNVKKN